MADDNVLEAYCRRLALRLGYVLIKANLEGRPNQDRYRILDTWTSKVVTGEDEGLTLDQVASYLEREDVERSR